jgi:uncharacterized membrane protein
MNKKSKKGTDVKASSNSLPSENDEIQLVQQIQRFSGPIPDPETLSQYKDLYPESIKIIMDMAVKQADHRQHMEKDSFALEREILKSESKQANLGRFSAVLIITLILGVIVFAIIKGESTIGSILAGALISISGIFALGKHYTKNIEKAKKKDKQ